jgi:DNA-binding NarL/FixJ family response regulator
MPVETNGRTCILVVDDYEPFRRFLCTTIGEQPNLQVIGEVEDGLEAVRQAEALQPDLILLDIGLPGLNGIKAARRIAEVAANARIIFVSQESSDDVIDEACSLGSWGYVIKAQAGEELLAAINSVCEGRRFVSTGADAHSRPK